MSNPESIPYFLYSEYAPIDGGEYYLDIDKKLARNSFYSNQ
ncbi:hypothetical protein ACFL2V_01195 [Pseudomonadota bacterium]